MSNRPKSRVAQESVKLKQFLVIIGIFRFKHVSQFVEPVTVAARSKA
jgi:hypothetical protein